MVRQHSMCEFNSFKFVEVCFMTKELFYLSECPMGTCSLFVEWSVLYMSIRYWFQYIVEIFLTFADFI